MIEKTYAVEYASEVLKSVPYGFIDKTVCGCGLTTVAIESNEPCIIAVPNVPLVVNKIAQYPNSRCNYKLLGVYGGISVDAIAVYRQTVGAQPIKIICTWDSVWKVEDLVRSGVRLIIDESDNIITNMELKTDQRDNRERKDIINYLLDLAKEFQQTTSFITATPIPLKYLPDWISNIDYLKLHWSNTCPVKPITMKRATPYYALKEEIIKPLRDSDFIIKGDRRFSKVIVFINSVKTITNICRECKLDKEEVSILCSESSKNDAKVRGYHKLEYNSLRKFNFVTSSGFQGIDMYDDDCMNVVVSCSDTNYHLIDLATSLKQAIARNRSKINPCRDRFIFIYNQTIFKESEEDLIREIESLRSRIEDNISVLNSLDGDSFQAMEKTLLQANDFYVYAYKDKEKYVFNLQRFNADMYFIVEVRRCFVKGFTIMGGSLEIKQPHNINKEYNDGETYASLYRKVMDGEDISIYEGCESYKILMEYYNLYGEYCQNKTNAEKKIISKKELGLLSVVKEQLRFEVGELYTKAEIKTRLQKVYTALGMTRKAKSTDLNEIGITYKIVSKGNEKFIKIGE